MSPQEGPAAAVRCPPSLAPTRPTRSNMAVAGLKGRGAGCSPGLPRRHPGGGHVMWVSVAHPGSGRSRVKPVVGTPPRAHPPCGPGYRSARSGELPSAQKRYDLATASPRSFWARWNSAFRWPKYATAEPIMVPGAGVRRSAPERVQMQGPGSSRPPLCQGIALHRPGVLRRRGNV